MHAFLGRHAGIDISPGVPPRKNTSAASCLTLILELVGCYLKIYSDGEVNKDVIYWMAMTKHPIACGSWPCCTFTVLQVMLVLDRHTS